MENIKLSMEIQGHLSYKKSFLYEGVKRGIDIVLAVVGILIGIPIVAIFGVLTKLEDKGPIFYTQERLGKDGNKFTLYKIRSMRVDAEKNGAQWAKKNDDRITKVGSFIRKTRIDEIPQLFNVLRGEMSLVGPRPERPIFTYQFNEEIPGFINRLVVKPGLTGWAQVNGGYEMSPKEKLEADLYYIENKNIRMDLYILLKTIKIVLTGAGAR